MYNVLPAADAAELLSLQEDHLRTKHLGVLLLFVTRVALVDLDRHGADHPLCATWARVLGFFGYVIRVRAPPAQSIVDASAGPPPNGYHLPCRAPRVVAHRR
jgi:hypothetical protein